MQSVLETYKNPVGPALFEQMAQRVGIEDFHDFQRQAITAVSRGRDSFLVVPTGSGKSFCYTVPALFLPGMVLVISPLIALMRDQQRQLAKLDIPSLSFDSHMGADEKRAALRSIAQGEIKVLYISPERLALNGFREMLRGLKLSLIAVDEAHCVQQWGQGFRPEYARLGSLIAELGPVPKMALTATVTPRERHEIIRSLGMKDPQVIAINSVRDNLDLAVYHHSKPGEQVQGVVETAAAREDQGIIYAATRKNVEEIYRQLRALKHPVAQYHAGLMPEVRQRSQDQFVAGKILTMVATKAFGMGINLPMIRYVLHANMPCSIESYTQEIGRAGRDGYQANCDLHYGPKDYFLQKFMIEKSFPDEKELPKVWRALEENFADRVAYDQDKLIQLVGLQTLLPKETIEAAVEFFVKGGALELVETVAEEEDFQYETYVAMNARNPGLPSLLQGLRDQVAWKFDKLNAMHQLVKGSSSPKLSIERYFA